MTEKLIHTDRRILNYMLENDCENRSKIAKDLKLPIPTLHTRINSLRKRGIIKRLVPDLDVSKIGLSTLTLIEVNVKDQGIIPQLNKKFGQSANVVISFAIYENYDYLLGIYISSQEELEYIKESLKKFPGVKMIYASIVGSVYRFSTSPFLIKGG